MNGIFEDDSNVRRVKKVKDFKNVELKSSSETKKDQRKLAKLASKLDSISFDKIDPENFEKIAKSKDAGFIEPKINYVSDS